MSIEQLLRDHNACYQAIQTHGQEETLQYAWDKCQRPDWMIWVLRRTEAKNNKKLFVQIALFAAESTIHFSKDKQQRPQKAIEAVKAWLLDPSEENRIACKHDAAVDAAAAAAAYAAYAAYAVDDAAAVYAVYIADAAAAAAVADVKREQIAEYIRQIHPIIGEMIK